MHRLFLPRLLLALLVLLSAALARADAGDAHELDQRFPRSTLQIATPDARLHHFDVWVADTDQRRARGLMFVRELADDHGMLFVYGRVQVIGMWMKNTFIPLDMLFVSPDGKIAHVVEHTTPHSLETISSEQPVLAVIELKAGTAARLRIKPGAQVMHSAFARR